MHASVMKINKSNKFDYYRQMIYDAAFGTLER